MLVPEKKLCTLLRQNFTGEMPFVKPDRLSSSESNSWYPTERSELKCWPGGHVTIAYDSLIGQRVPVGRLEDIRTVISEEDVEHVQSKRVLFYRRDLLHCCL